MKYFDVENDSGWIEVERKSTGAYSVAVCHAASDEMAEVEISKDEARTLAKAILILVEDENDI